MTVIAMCSFNGKMAHRLHESYDYRRSVAKGNYHLQNLLWKYAQGYVVGVTKDPRGGVPFYGYLVPAGWFNIEWRKQ